MNAFASLEAVRRGARSSSALLILGIVLSSPAGAHTPTDDCATSGSHAQNAVSFRSCWADGIDPRIVRQVPNADAIAVVPMAEFGGPALKATMNRTADFTGVANGTPRAELAFAGLPRFAVGGAYEVRWSTMIPRSYELDQQQSEIITQIHQSSPHGAPPFSLMLAGNRYQVEVRGVHAAKIFSFGDPRKDEGKVVSWLLRYEPDDSGAASVTDLFKDGVLVVHGGAVENAYPRENHAYLKIGLYKWDWKSRPSDVEVRTMYYGDISVKTLTGSQFAR